MSYNTKYHTWYLNVGRCDPFHRTRQTPADVPVRCHEPMKVSRVYTARLWYEANRINLELPPHSFGDCVSPPNSISYSWEYVVH